MVEGDMTKSMRTILQYANCITMFLMLFSFTTSAQQLNLVVGLSKPPYVIEETQTGFELELVKSLAKQLNYDVKFLFVPFGRTHKMLKKERVDGILTSNIHIIPYENLLTRPYISYQNVVITLQKTNFDFKSISDLKNHSVAAFQNASKLLGADYYDAISKATLYLEIPDQMRQLTLLYLGKVDAIVIDINIFNGLLENYKGDNVKPHQVHTVFPHTFYSLSFKNPEQVNKFDAVIKSYLTSAEYRTLLKTYQVSQSAQLYL